MKKTALALALAGLVAGPSIAAADTTVYGSIRLSERYTSPQDDAPGDSNWDLVNNSSRLGFKGSEDLGNGQSVVYQYEFGVNAPDGPTIGGARNRLAYVGFKGGWGQATFGTQWNPYYFAVGGEVDVWGDSPFTGAGGYYNNGGFTRSNNMLVYATPDFNGLKAFAAIENDGARGDNNIDKYQIAAIYDNGPLFVGAGWRNTSEDTQQANAFDAGFSPLIAAQVGKLNQYGVSARYNFSFGLGIAGEWNQRNEDSGLSTNGWDALVYYNWGRTRFAVSAYGISDDSQTYATALNPALDVAKLKIDKQKGWNVGVQHRFSKRTRAWVEYGQTNNDGVRVVTEEQITAGFSPKLKINHDVFSIGMRHDF